MSNRKSITFANIPGDTWERKYKAAKTAGFDGVEVLSMFNHEDHSDHRALFTKYGLAASASYTIHNLKYPLAASEPFLQANCLEYSVRSIWTANDMNDCNTIILPTDTIPEGVSKEEAVKNIAVLLGRIAQYAGVVSPKDTSYQNKYTIMALEPCSKLWNTPEEFAAFVDGLGIANVKVCFNTAKISGDHAKWISVLGDRIVRVHVGCSDGKALLSGDVDFKAVMSALKEVGYDGWLNADFDPDERGIEGISADLDVILGY